MAHECCRGGRMGRVMLLLAALAVLGAGLFHLFRPK